jgi:hypothetical protein
MCAWAWGDSFDCYAAPADAINGYWDSGTTTTLALAAGRFAGSQSLRNGTSSTVLLVKSSAQNDAVHHLSFAFQQTSAISGSSLCYGIQLLDGTTVQCSIVFRGDGAILLTSGAIAGTVLATYAGAFPVVSTWYAFEIEIVVHNSTGSFKVRKNGNTVDDHSTTGIDTAGGTANNYANKLQLATGTGGALNQYFDDLYWRSDASSVPWLGDMKCITRYPASDAAVQFSRTPTGVLTQTVPTTASNNLLATTTAAYTAFTAGYDGTVTSVGVGVNAVGTAVNMKCAIFADNGSGRPGALLASATAPVTPVVIGTHTFAFTGLAVVKGTQYWIGAAMDGATAQWTAGPTTATTGATSATSYAAFPQTNPVTTMPAQPNLKSWTYTATPANWQAVAEAQQDATTSYVYDSVPGHADLYGINAIASTPLTTFAVTTRAYAIKSDAGTRTAAVQLKSGATTDASSTVVLTTSGWQWAWKHYTTNPATSGAWTASAVNSIQCGPVVIA